MEIRRLLLICLILGIFLLQGCASVYIPNAHHTHQLDRKGEISSSVQTGFHGIDAQVAYAVSDKLGILGAVSFGSNESEGSQDYHKHSYVEAGVEYFSPFWGSGRFEFMGGGGVGSATSVTTYDFFGPETVQATGQYNKLFVQSNVGLETNWIEVGLALRMGNVTFTEFETSSTTYGDSESGTFFEPAVFTRLGWKNIKLEGQVGVSMPLQKEQDVKFDYRPFLLSLGLHFNL